MARFNRNWWVRLLPSIVLLLGSQATAVANEPIFALGAYGRFTHTGIVVLHVQPFSAAARINLQPGDTIVGINGQAIYNQRQYVAVINHCGGRVILGVRKRGMPPGSRIRYALILPRR